MSLWVPESGADHVVDVGRQMVAIGKPEAAVFVTKAMIELADHQLSLFEEADRLDFAKDVPVIKG